MSFNPTPPFQYHVTQGHEAWPAEVSEVVACMTEEDVRLLKLLEQRDFDSTDMSSYGSDTYLSGMADAAFTNVDVPEDCATLPLDDATLALLLEELLAEPQTASDPLQHAPEGYLQTQSAQEPPTMHDPSATDIAEQGLQPPSPPLSLRKTQSWTRPPTLPAGVRVSPVTLHSAEDDDPIVIMPNPYFRIAPSSGVIHNVPLPRRLRFQIPPCKTIMFTSGGTPPRLWDLLTGDAVLDGAEDAIFADCRWVQTKIEIDIPRLCDTRHTLRVHDAAGAPLTRTYLAKHVSHEIHEFLINGKRGKHAYPFREGIIPPHLRAWPLDRIHFCYIRLVALDYFPKTWVPRLMIEEEVGQECVWEDWENGDRTYWSMSICILCTARYRHVQIQLVLSNAASEFS
ncbi:hypothetical protein BD626DRAFT_513636 [Schizophyllum amplum]|uniref:Uncharacterized protein n=1 Tax=Schizophyllum amplum TaxID=97359 RepID=A0A550BZ40_9AGAR|nr:hypothetical protein BD626DRAFT_513636 [Auriculariopsis ampla]